jgi:hypothetical protein
LIPEKKIPTCFTDLEVEWLVYFDHPTSKCLSSTFKITYEVPEEVGSSKKCGRVECREDPDTEILVPEVFASNLCNPFRSREETLNCCIPNSNYELR